MKYYLSLFSLCWLTSIPGCSGGPDDIPKLGDVSGTIKVDGQPKSDLTVQFQPDEGRPSTGTTDNSGYYELRYSMDEDGAVAGKGLLTIRSKQPEDAGCCGCCCGEETFEDPIPPRYNINAANNPDMKVEVKAGENNTFDFDIDTSIRDEAPAQDTGDCGCCCS